MIIQQKNLLADNSQKTYLSFPEVASTGVLRWQNPAGFNASWAVQVGETGQDQTEIVVLGTASPSGTAGTFTGNTLYTHPANTALYAIKYDQVVFEVSTTGTAGTAVVITDGTVNLTPDSAYTNFDHTTGSLSYAYKTYWKNSVSGSTTSESDWFVGTVPTYAVGGLVRRVRSKLWHTDFVSDDDIKDWLGEWNEHLNNLAVQTNEDYNLGSTTVAFSGTQQMGTITNENFKQIRRVWYTQDGNNWYQSTKMDINRFLPSETFYDTRPYFYMYGDNVIGRRPADASGTMGIIYYQISTKLDNDYDFLPLPVRSYSKSFVDYCDIQIMFKDGKVTLQDKLTMEKALEDNYKQQIAPRNKSGPTYIDVVDITGGEQGYYF
jgi:hypothetical protein